MEKIKSFTVDHLCLNPGIYESRRDQVGQGEVVTYDLRITAPNREPVINTGEVHSIEHLAATYLRNHPKHKDQIIYFGPMGCRTGFYLLVNATLSGKDLYELIKETFEFISTFDDEIPGASAKDCGNYHDNNLPMARWIALKYLKDLEKITDFTFSYKD